MRTALLQMMSTSIARITSAILQGISYILLARATNPSDFGRMASIIGIGIVVQAIADAGITTFLTRERAEHPHSQLLAGALTWNRRISVIITVLTALALAAAGETLSQSFFELVPLAIWVGCEKNVEASLSILHADGDWRIWPANLMLRRAGAVAIYIALISIEVPPLLAFSLAWASSAAIAALVTRQIVMRRVSSGREVGLGELIRMTYHYWILSVAMNASNLDTSIVGISAGAAQSGAFSAASRLVSPLRILPQALARALLPMAARNRSQRRSLTDVAVLATLTVAGLSFMYLGMAVTAPRYIVRLLGNQYTDALVPIRNVLLGLPFAAAISILNALLQGLGYARFVAYTAVIATAGYLVALVMVSHAYGAAGATVLLGVTYAIHATTLLAGTIVLSRVTTLSVATPNHQEA